jgi:hypothetical protein
MIPLLAKKDIKCVTIIKKTGIVVEDSNGVIGFTSPLAKRFFTRHLFPYRSHTDPDSLKSLVLDSVKQLSSSRLRGSTSSDSFPKEAVFQNLLMRSLALSTPPPVRYYTIFQKSVLMVLAIKEAASTFTWSASVGESKS